MKLPKKIQEISDNEGVDIQNFTNYDINTFTYLYNSIDSFDLIQGDKNIRSSFMNKENILAFSGGISISIDIFFIKLFREGIVDIKLFFPEYDINTIEGKEFYKFLNKYTLNNSNSTEDQVSSSLLGNTIINLKSIIDNEYEIFMNHVLLNMLPGKMELDEFNYDEATTDKFCMDVTIKDYKAFFKGYCKLLSSKNKKNEIINILKGDFDSIKNVGSKEKSYLVYNLTDFYNNTGIYIALMHLEKSGKISNLDFSINDFTEKNKSIMIEFIPHSHRLLDIFFDDLELFSINNKNDYISIEYIKEGLNLIKGGKIAFFKNNSFPFRIVEMFYKNYKENKTIKLQRLHKNLFGDEFEREYHKKDIIKIKSAISSINRSTNEMNNGKQLLTFAGESLKEL